MLPLAFAACGTTHTSRPDSYAAMVHGPPSPAAEDLLPSAALTGSPSPLFFNPQVFVCGDFHDNRRGDAGRAVPDDAGHTAFVYPVIAHAMWNKTGFLSSYNKFEPLLGVGVVDFAGSLAVLRPRKGRFYEDVGGRRCADDEELP